jgi:regulator of RNase E activity RraA
MESLLKKFHEISTGSISDAFDKVGIVRGVAVGIEPIFQGAKAVGTAVTMRQVPTRMGEPGLARHEEVAINICKPGDVLVIDAGGKTDYVSWGGNNSLYAKTKGLKGVVIDGATRDAEEIIEIKFPVFVRGLSPVKSSTRWETVSINEPIQIGNCQVRPGDIIVADDDGIVAVPRDKAEEVLKLATKKEEFDNLTKEEVRKGTPLELAFKKAREKSGW